MKVIKWIDNYLEEILMVVLLIAISFIMIAQVIARYVFQSAFTWSDELARYLLVWAGFLSVSFCVKKRISIKIEQFQNALPTKARPFLKVLRHAIVFIFCIIMIPFSWTYLMQAVSTGATSSSMGIPMTFIQSAPLVGFVLLAIRVLQALVREFKASWGFMRKVVKDELEVDESKKMTEEEIARIAPEELPPSNENADVWLENFAPDEEVEKLRQTGKKEGDK